MTIENSSKVKKGKPLPIALVIDTNILIEMPEIHDFNWGFGRVQLFVLDTVVEELRKKQYELAEPEKAKKAYELMSQYQVRTPPEGIPIRDGQSRLFFIQAPKNISADLDLTKVDHQLIAFAMEHIQHNPGQFCAVVSLDREVADLANSVKPRVKPISPSMLQLERQLRSFLLRQYKSWLDENQSEGQKNNGGQTHEPTIPSTDKDKPKRSDRKVDKRERLDRVVKNFHSRIIAAHHRAILSIAPLEARLSLTAHLIKCLKRTERRVILLFVENQALADYWAAELRQRCQLSPSAVLVFHDQALSHRAEVIVYRHDQIETRFRQHVARLRETRKLITILVDGCDLLAPENLVMLLLGNDQFIGYTRHPLTSSQARSGRMLANFFEEESIVNYTYAEAEQDGWLRSFDLIRKPVLFTPEENEEYEKLNQSYLKERKTLLERYPHLTRAGNLWDALQDLLEGVADAHAAQVFTWRERREEMAQLAGGKGIILLDILKNVADSSGRNIIYDPSNYWSKALGKTINEQELSAVHLSQETSPEDWDRAWRKFESGDVETLVISSLPPYGMIHSAVKRLIITTPICPQAQLSNIIDWTLSHAHPGGDPVEIHLLYVPDSPEEQAMLEFADAICGLRFN